MYHYSFGTTLSAVLFFVLRVSREHFLHAGQIESCFLLLTAYAAVYLIDSMFKVNNKVSFDFNLCSKKA